MKKVLLLIFILIISLSFVLLAAERPQTITEKQGLTAKDKLDTFSPVKRFNVFQGKYSTQSNLPTEAVYLNEGFEGTFPPTGWTLVNAGVGFVQTDLRAQSGTYSAYHNDDSGQQDDWLVTPAIDLTGSASARLNFWQNENYYTYYTFHGIYVTTDTTGIMGDTTSWTLIYEGVSTEDVWEQTFIDLSAYDGQTIYLGFYYSGDYADEWYLDDLIVEDTPQIPVMKTLFTQLTAPPTPVGTTVSDSFGIVTNTGAVPLSISSITVTNTDFAVSPAVGTVDPGDTLFVEGSFTPSAVGLISGEIIIQGDDPDNSADTVLVSGIGYPVNYVVEQFNDWPFYPYNFTRINANDDAYQWGWFQYFFASGDSTLCAGIRWATDGNDDYLVTPPIPVADGDFISFQSWIAGATYPETWQVLVSTTDRDVTSFTVGLDTVTSYSTTPVFYTYDLSAFAGQTIYVAIRNVSVDQYYQFVDNVMMPMPNYPVFINEVYYDSPSTDAGTFTELFGMPGMSLDGYSLIGINGNGGTVYSTVNITGMSIPESRFFVVGQDNTVPNVTMIDAGVDWQNGPDNVSLMNGADTVDAMGYGDFSSAVFTGRGNPAVDVFGGVSLSRYPDGMNTNDNAADFHATYPTPGIDNDPPEAIIGGSTSPLTFGTVTLGSDSSRDYTIYNNGSADLVVDTIAAASPVFTSTIPDTIAPGGSGTITVTFAPTQGIEYVDTLVIYSNDPVNGERGIPLSGTGELSAQNAQVILAAQIGGDSQYRSFWVNGSWDSSGVYNSNWTGPMVQLSDNGVAPDSVAGDHIFTGSVILAIDAVNTYHWWTGSENDANSFLEDGVGFTVLSSSTVTPDTLIVDGDNGINDWVISLAGDFNGWNNSSDDMTRSNTIWSIVIPLDAGTYGYKYTVMHQWNAAYGSGGVGSAGSNYSITIADSGLYKFTFNDANNSQSVEPYIEPVFFEDFETYVADSQLTFQNSTDWTTWSGTPGTAEDPYVTEAHAFSGTKSVVIAPDNDLVHRLGNKTSGRWIMDFEIYIPTGKSGYFNTLSIFDPGANNFEWMVEIFFDVSGGGRLEGLPASPVAFSYPHNTWIPVKVIADLDSNLAKFYLDGSLVYSWQYTAGGNILQLAANDFFGAETTDEMYLDDYAVRADTALVGISNKDVQVPMEYALHQNYPNPFNPTTTIRYDLKQSGNVTLTIFNTLGQKVRTLVNERQEAGFKTVIWDGLNSNGNRVASGVYIYQIQAGNFVKARKMILMK